MPVFKRQDREAVSAAGLTFSFIALVIAVGALVTVAEKDDGGAAVVAGGVPVSLSEFAVNPADVTVPVGGTLTVTNNGQLPHNLAVEDADPKTPDLGPAEAASLDVADLEAGDYTVYCTIAGHRGSGMEAALHVGGGGGGDAGHDAHAKLLETNDADDATMKEPVDAYVAQLDRGANTAGVGNQPLEPTVLPDGTKEFVLVAEIIDWEVAPGQIVTAWAYNGQVPGPWIKVQSGDKVRVVLDNQLPQSTSIHFHGIETPNAMDGVPDVTQAPVKPGATFTYEFVAQGPALGMYHSHHHAEHQVPDGLAGIFQIDDVPLPAGTGSVTQEVPMVLNDAGAIGLTLNGKSFPATAPVMAKVGDRVAINYLNEGLQIHPMHLHGIPQLVVAKDGFPLPSPYTVDTLNVAPGERYTVLVQPTEADLGVWAFHCHILNHAEGDDGMFGMVTTFIVQ